MQKCCSGFENNIQGGRLISSYSSEVPLLQMSSTLCFCNSSQVVRVHNNWFHMPSTCSIGLNLLQEIQNDNQNIIMPFLSLLSVCSNGLNGTISVYPLEGSMAGMMPTAASSTSPTAYTILDVDQNAYLFVGGIFGTVKVSVCLTVYLTTSPQTRCFSLLFCTCVF